MNVKIHTIKNFKCVLKKLEIWNLNWYELMLIDSYYDTTNLGYVEKKKNKNTIASFNHSINIILINKCNNYAI